MIARWEKGELEMNSVRQCVACPLVDTQTILGNCHANSKRRIHREKWEHEVRLGQRGFYILPGAAQEVECPTENPVLAHSRARMASFVLCRTGGVHGLDQRAPLASRMRLTYPRRTRADKSTEFGSAAVAATSPWTLVLLSASAIHVASSVASCRTITERHHKRSLTVPMECFECMPTEQLLGQAFATFFGLLALLLLMGNATYHFKEKILIFLVRHPALASLQYCYRTSSPSSSNF